MSASQRQHVAFCRDNECTYCQALREEHADRIAEERAEDAVQDMESRYEEEVFDQWGPQT